MADATDTAKYFADPGVLLPVRGSAAKYGLKDARDFIRRKLKQYNSEKQIMIDGRPEKMAYTIEWKGKLVGGIGFTPFGHKAEIGYWLARPYWGQGLTVRAVKMFVRYLNKKYRFTKFEAKVFSFNIPSTRVLEKAGFKREGFLVHDFKVGRKYFDHILYGLVM